MRSPNTFEVPPRERHERYAREFGHLLGFADPAGPDAPRVLSISSAPPLTEVELCLLKSLARREWSIHTMVMMQPAVVRSYYQLLRSATVHDWRDYWDVSPEGIERAEALLAASGSMDAILRLRDGPVRIGGHALALTRRHLRIGTVELAIPAVRDQLRYFLAASMAAADAIRRAIADIRPSLVLAIDTAYSPKGEILDTCAAMGIPFIRWYPAHRSNALLFKRYHAGNINHDLSSLSDATWNRVRLMPWDSQSQDRVGEEIGRAYRSGDWYGESGTQFNTIPLEPDEVRQQLGLESRGKTAFVFPHIAWDASFGRGVDLFDSYEDWLEQTVRAAIANSRLQWVVKVHPAHVGKSRVDDWDHTPSEEAFLRLRFPELPRHVKVLPANIGIRTDSLFAVMDYCLTVRGTVGLEASRLGVPVLTGGTGRYDQRGFTIDSETRGEYLARLERLHEVPPLTQGQVELANRYAYGLFTLRPLPLTSVSLEFHPQHGAADAFSHVRLQLHDERDWDRAEDLEAFAQWAVRSRDDDYVHDP